MLMSIPFILFYLAIISNILDYFYTGRILKKYNNSQKLENQIISEYKYFNYNRTLKEIKRETKDRRLIDRINIALFLSKLTVFLVVLAFVTFILKGLRN